MMAALADLLPDGVPVLGALALIAFSAFTSALTAAVGIGGGVLLLVAMTFVLPIAALIPVHGVVQLGSNAGRAVLLARQTAIRLLLPFLIGAVVGVAIGAFLVRELPEAAILLAIGAFVLVTTWVKVPALGTGQPAVLAGGGLLATILTMFIGATGPFVMALLAHAPLTHTALVATMAVAMTAQHTLKVAAFGAIGFDFVPWLAFIGALVASGFVGTVIGTRLLKRLPEANLRRALKLVLTVLGLQLLARGVYGLV